MQRMRLILVAMLLSLPFAATAKATVIVGVVDGPEYVPAPVAYGPPVCEWGYYSYYPYTCAPYGYYGSDWFYDGVFIGVGPWYGWGWRDHGWRSHGWRGRGWGDRDGYRYGSQGGYRGGHGAIGGPVRSFEGGASRSGFVGGGGGTAGGRGGFSGGGGHSGGHGGGGGGGGHR